MGLDVNGNDFVLCTIHRAENTDSPERLGNIFKGLGDSGETIILPLHPRTRGKIAEQGIKIPVNVSVIDPVGYLEMVWLESHCKCVATDSGGVQKEAYFFGKPCVTLRDETEWVELVEVGANSLVGANEELIVERVVNSRVSKPITGEIFGSGAAGIEVSKALTT
jgi:UDP-GlcNAc3NAcA epimerase